MGIETLPVMLRTQDGLALEGDLGLPGGAPVAAAVVCHPHPLYGGDRFNGVVDAVVRALADAGVIALRFDFRGVNGSEGAHGGGVGERLDVVAAIDHLAAVEGASGRPLWLVGYSFGASVVLSVDDPRAAGWVAIAPPLAMMPAEGAVPSDPRPKHVVVAGHDQFSPPAATTPIVEAWTNTSVEVLTSADHFLAGHLAEVGRLAVAATVS